MSWPALAQAVRPASRAVAWTPLLAVGSALLVVATLGRLVDGRMGPLPMLAAASLAAVVDDAAHDPAERVLSPLPLSGLARRLLRVALVAAPASAALVLVTGLLPDASRDLLLPGLALALSGLALATWLPPDRDVRVAAAVPLVWVSLHLVLGDLAGFVGAVTGWWLTQSVVVCVVSTGLIAFGSRR